MLERNLINIFSFCTCAFKKGPQLMTFVFCSGVKHTLSSKHTSISFAFELFLGLWYVIHTLWWCLELELSWQWPELTVCHKNMRINNRYIDNCHSLTHFVFIFVWYSIHCMRHSILLYKIGFVLGDFCPTVNVLSVFMVGWAFKLSWSVC